MCSILGVYSGLENTDEFRKKLAKMQKRGPDSTHFYQDDRYFVGMNRLSINDISQGEQPFFSGDKNIVVVFNGEIYNHKKLREILQKDGFDFRTHCDGEILPAMYQKYGLGCFLHLDGMFGIAIYDKRKKKIILGRDYLGEKPLYFMHHRGRFAFSTLIEPLKESHFQLNPSAIWDFLTFGFIPEQNCIYKEIQSVPNGSFLEFDCEKNTYKISSFKDKVLENFSNPSHKDLVAKTRDLVMESVDDRLLSDVPLGSFLSGGLDSSIVSALVSKKIENLNTFNIAFAEGYDPYSKEVDESYFAKILAKSIRSKHHEIRVDGVIFQKYLESFIEDMDQPFGSISGIGVKIIAQKAREMGIKVLLSGDGADELFGGYPWYPKLKFSNPKFITQEKPKGWHCYAFESEKKEIFNQDFFSDNLDSRHFFPKADSEPLDFIQFDRDFYLPFEMMVKMDRMCMSEGVEGRACFVSPKILSFTQGLDYETLFKNGEKWLLKGAFKDILPQEILKREKHGNAPIDFWMKTSWLPLLEYALSDGVLIKLGILNKDKKEEFLQKLFSSDRRIGNIAFFLVVLNLWLEKNA